MFTFPALSKISISWPQCFICLVLCETYFAEFMTLLLMPISKKFFTGAARNSALVFLQVIDVG